MADSADITPPSRRLFLAAGPAAAVFGSFHVATAVEVDPIFAAIARHCSAHESFSEVCRLADSVDADNHGRIVTLEDEQAWYVANSTEERAARALVTTCPGTPAGMKAVLNHVGRHLDEFESAGLLSEFIKTLSALP